MKGSSDSLKEVRNRQTEFKTPPVSITPSPATSRWISSTQTGPQPSANVYYVTRNHYYSGLGWHPPVYVSYGAPSYGVWDAMFMWSMLDLHNEWAYHHHSDPAYAAWRRDADRLSQDNSELREKLAQLDNKISSMQGQPKDETYLPSEVGANIALAAEIVTGATTPKITFATGVEGSTYAALCDGNNDGVRGFKVNAKDMMDVECTKTDGSRDNIVGFKTGKYAMIVTQADAIDWALRKNLVPSFGKLQKTAYLESMWLLVNKDSDIKSVFDLKPSKHTLYVGPSGSGTALSFDNLAVHATKSSWLIFSTHNDQYQGVDIRNSSYATAVNAVAENPKNVLLVMTGGHSPFMEKIATEFGEKMRLIPLDGDSSFASIRDRDGNHVYQECSIPGGLYPKLLDSNTETLCVQSVVVVSPTWLKQNGQKGEDALLTTWDLTEFDLAHINAGVK